MTEPRFAVCTVGDDGFSVKDRKTSERLGYHRRQADAEKARDAFNRLYQEEEVTKGDGSRTDPASAPQRHRTHGQSRRKLRTSPEVRVGLAAEIEQKKAAN